MRIPTTTSRPRRLVLPVTVTALALATISVTSPAPGSITDARASAYSSAATEPRASTRPASLTALPPYASSSRKATKADVRHSWRKGCPVGPSSLRVLEIRYVAWDKKSARTGTLVVHKSVATKVRTVFRKLYASRYPIRRMLTVDAYGGSDRRSMRADNTSGFNCRFVAGTSNWSNHAYGRAIDVNPVENPYVNGSTVSPKAGRAYLDRSQDKKGLIKSRGKVVKAFRSQGFTWGGRWYDPDYQHFDLR